MDCSPLLEIQQGTTGLYHGDPGEWNSAISAPPSSDTRIRIAMNSAGPDQGACFSNWIGGDAH